MRSHLTNNSAETDEKLSNRSNKLSSMINNGGGSKTNHEACFEAGPHLSYGLRENPKKTWRFAYSSTEENSTFENKFCKECGKGFQSWKALFGHMKRHSEKERASTNNHNNSLEEQDSWTSANQKLVMDSQSDNETTTPNRKRRSQRRTRYMGITTNNSSSFSVVNNGSSSVSEIEHEQEEVAMCLMMLSRDGNHWGGSKSVAESSDNFSESSKSPSSKAAAKTSGANDSEISKSKKLNAKTNEASKLDSGFSKFRSRTNGTEVKDKMKMKFQKDDESELDQLGSKKYFNSSKRSLNHAHYDPELRSDSSKKLTPDVSVPEMCKISHKRSKFECTTCNKIFHSYQALGGHRASHKKTKGCLASIVDSSENSIETDNITPEPTAHDGDNKNLIDRHDMPANDDRKLEKKVEKINTVSKKSSKGHECPICLKVFPSGQALGGHKRSHLIGGNSDAKNRQTIVIEKPIPGIRDFLDLNLPAPDEEDSNGHVASLKPWWAGSSHKHEALVGLISN